MSYKFIKLDRTNEEMRRSFCELSIKTFGLDFEDWYQNGYWKENYLPYVCVKDDKVVANVSVNPMEFNMAGRHVKLIQLGTVMTEESERNQGLIRKIMEKIEQDFQDKTDGFFRHRLQKHRDGRTRCCSMRRACRRERRAPD